MLPAAGRRGGPPTGRFGYPGHKPSCSATDLRVRRREAREHLLLEITPHTRNRAVNHCPRLSSAATFSSSSPGSTKMSTTMPC